MIKILIKLASGEELVETYDKSSVVIGRSSKCDVKVSDDSLSRQHCQIDLINGEFYVTDLGSANGVYLKGERIPTNEKVLFSTFFQLTLGILELQVEEICDQDISSLQGRQGGYHTGRKWPLLKNDPQDKTNIRQSNYTANVKEKKLKVNFVLLLSVAILGLCSIGYFYFFAPVTEDQTFTKTDADTASPSTKVPDEFLTTEKYLEMFEKKSCKQDFEICIELRLSEVDKEGVYRDGEEYVIFIDPAKKSSSKYKVISNLKDREALSAMSLLTNSKFFQRYLNKDISQIHLVTLDRNKIPSIVYRFHASYLSDHGRYESSMRTALAFRNAKSFYKKRNKFIQIKEL